jgi:hypothetical protein
MTQRNQLHCHEEILSVSRQLPQVKLEKAQSQFCHDVTLAMDFFVNFWEGFFIFLTPVMNVE